MIMEETLWLMQNNVTHATPLKAQINFQKYMLQF